MFEDTLNVSLSCTQLLAVGRRCPGFVQWVLLTLCLNPVFLDCIPAGAQRNWESFFAQVFVHDHRTAAARGLVNFLRGLIAQGLVWAFGVVKGKVFRQTYQ